MIAAAFALVASLPWILPVIAAGVGALVTLVCGGDWWLATICAAGLAGFVLIWRLFGLKPALAWLLAVAAVLIDQRAAERGAARQAEKGKADAEKRAAARERVQDDVASLPDAELRRRARRWVSD